MLSRHHNFYQQVLQLMDGLLVGLALWIAYALRFFVFNDLPWMDPLQTEFANCYWMIFLTIPVAPMALEWMDVYHFQPPITWGQSVWRIMRGLGVVLIVLFAAVVVFRIPQTSVSRVALGLFFILGTSLISIRSGLFLLWLRRRGSRVYTRKHILLCGTPTEREAWKKRFMSQPGRNFHIAAEFDLHTDGMVPFVEMLHEQAIDIVVFSVSEQLFPLVREALLACEAEGVEAWVAADFIQALFARVQYDHFEGHPLLVYRTTPAISWELVVKRLLDLVGGAVLLVLALPLMLAVALLVRGTSKGPIIFSQNRSGLHGRPFRLYKFRTMITNAEQARGELAALNEMTGPVFKLNNDPRVTKLGHWLRKTSLDELPQLWNVVRGEMSLVGPRPLPIYETANFGDIGQRRRMSVRPGLTCLWQVRGRNKITDFRDWVRLDLEYIDCWSLWLDLKILLRTLPVVLFGWGAK